MAGDLKPGDATRSQTGLRQVTRIEDGGLRPVITSRLVRDVGFLWASSAYWPTTSRSLSRLPLRLIAQQSRPHNPCVRVSPRR